MPNSVNHRKVYWTCGRIIFRDINLLCFFFYLLIVSFFFPAVKSKPVLVTSREECEQIESSKKPWIWPLCPSRLSSIWRNVEACQPQIRNIPLRYGTKEREAERGNEKRIWEVSEHEALNSTSWRTPERDFEKPKGRWKECRHGNNRMIPSLEDGPEEARTHRQKQENLDKSVADTWELLFGHTDMDRGLPWWLGVKNPPASAGDTGSTPGSGRSPGEGNGSPLQYSCLENPLDRGVWRATAHGVAEDSDMT